MLIITNLYNESLPLMDVDKFERKQGINGDNEVILSIKRTKRNAEAFDLIETESIITHKNNKYRIKLMDKETLTNGVIRIEATAWHVFYDSIDNFQHDIIKGEKVLSLHQALTHTLKGTSITFTIKDEFERVSFEDFGEDNSIALFDEVKTKYNFEFSVENNLITVVKNLGKKQGKQMRYKHNIKAITVEDNTHDLATHIKGFGKPVEDEEGNQIEGKYIVQDEYTSPNVEKYGMREATPYYNEKIVHKPTLRKYLIERLLDEPRLTFSIEYDELVKNLNTKLEDTTLGDAIYLIHEPMNLAFQIRVAEIIDYPLHPHKKPTYTLSTQPIDLIGDDKNAMSIVSKNQSDKEIAGLHDKQSEISKRIEKGIEDLAELDNTLINLEKELERLENETKQEVEQAIKETEIPEGIEQPFPIPNSKLWWDSSVNPSRLKRWDGNKWIVLANTKEEIDDLIQATRDEAVSTVKKYTDEEVLLAREGIQAEIKDKIGDVQDNIDSLDDLSISLKTQVNKIDKEIESIETTITNDKLEVSQDLADLKNTAKNLTNKTTLIDTEIKTQKDKIDETILSLLDKVDAEWVNGELVGKVNQEDYDIQRQEILEDLAGKTDLEYVDGVLTGKADKEDTYTKVDVDNELDKRVTKVDYKTDKDGIVERLEVNESAITQQEGEIASKVSQDTYDVDINDSENGLKSKLGKAESSITQNAKNIKSKVSQIDHDNVIDRVKAAESSITQNAGSIESKVSQTQYNTDITDPKTGLKEKMSKAESSITQQAGQIASKVEKSDYKTDKDGIISDLNNQESRITQTEKDITSKVSQTIYDTDKQKTDSKLTQHDTSITQNATSIKSKAELSYVDTKVGAVQDYASTIEQTAQQLTIDFTALEEEQTAIETQVGKHESSITANAKAIGAKLDSTEYNKDKTGILSSIEKNQTDIQATAKGLELTVTKDEFADAEGRISAAESNIGINAEGLKLKANSQDVYTKSQVNTELGKKVATTVYNKKMGEIDATVNGLNTKFTNVNSKADTNTGKIANTEKDITSLNVRAQGIEANVRKVTDDVSGISEDVAGIVVEADRIASEVKANKKDADGKITNNSTAITQTASQIRAELKSFENSYAGDKTGILAGIEKNSTDIKATSEEVSLRVTKEEFEEGVESTKNYVQSRGENLVTNGTGLLGDNTNFSNSVFDGAVKHSGAGSFKTTGLNIQADELIPYDIDREYKLSFYTKSEKSLGSNITRLGFYDIDKNTISRQHLHREDFSKTRLAKDLKVGDTEIHLESVDDFRDDEGLASHLRIIMLYGYKNSYGFEYEDYTRYAYRDLWSDNDIDRENNIIHLTNPFSHSNPNDSDGVWRKGHEVSSGLGGDSYAFSTTYVDASEEWKKIQNLFSSSSNTTNGTSPLNESIAYIKIYILTNRSLPTDESNTTWVNAVEFTDVTDIEQVKENVSDAQERITKTEADIKVNADAIKLKASQDSVDKKVDSSTYTEKIGQLDVTIDNITGKVTDNETNINKHTGEIESARSDISKVEQTAQGIRSDVSSLSADVTTAKKDISRVEQKADSVTTTVGKIETDVSGLDGKMTSVQTEIEQLPDNISLAVSEGIDGLEIGGTNLVSNQPEAWGGAIKEFRSDGTIYLSNPTQIEWGNFTSTKHIELLPNESLTFSFQVLDIHKTAKVQFRRIGGSGATSYKTSTIPDKKGRFVHTYKNITGETITISPWITLYANDGSNDGTQYIHVKDIQVEKGNKATDWSLAEEDRVNKTNVLSSINLSKEGIAIEANKIDLKGLVSILNEDGSTATQIKGDKIYTGSILAHHLAVNEIFGNRAVIDKIQSGSVKTAELDASQINTGILNAKDVSVINLSASVIKTGTLDGNNVNVRNLSASNINSGTLNADNVLIRGGSNTNYTQINGAFLESRGQFSRTWRGVRARHDIKMKLENGYLRARNDSKAWSLYFSDMGISTYADAEGGESASGTLAFRDYTHSGYAGITLHSHWGIPAIESEENQVIIAPHKSTRSGTNQFHFAVKDNNSWQYTDGWIGFGDLSTKTYNSGIRFSKDSGLHRVYATNGNGDIGTGQFDAASFRGELVPRGDYNYIRATRTRFVNPGTETQDYADIQFNRALARSIRATEGNFYIGATIGEARVMNNLFTTYRPVRASNYHTSSSIDYKSHFEEIEESSLDIINQTHILKYRLDGDLENRLYNNEQVGVISELNPQIASTDGKAIDLYKYTNHIARATQELSNKSDKQDSDIEAIYDVLSVLIDENKKYKNRISELEQLLA